MPLCLCCTAGAKDRQTFVREECKDVVKALTGLPHQELVRTFVKSLTGAEVSAAPPPQQTAQASPLAPQQPHQQAAAAPPAAVQQPSPAPVTHLQPFAYHPEDGLLAQLASELASELRQSLPYAASASAALTTMQLAVQIAVPLLEAYAGLCNVRMPAFPLPATQQQLQAELEAHQNQTAQAIVKLSEVLQLLCEQLQGQ